MKGMGILGMKGGWQIWQQPQPGKGTKTDPFPLVNGD
jgi:hypothetical protein